MNLESLKEMFLTGDETDIDQFVSNLKPRCIKMSDFQVEVNGVTEKLVFNSENKTYFDRFMNLYKYCEYCDTVHPVDDFVTVEIEWYQSSRTGRDLRRRTETVCKQRLESGESLVPSFDFVNNRNMISSESGLPVYLYIHADETITVHLADGRVAYCYSLADTGSFNIDKVLIPSYESKTRKRWEYWEINDNFTPIVDGVIPEYLFTSEIMEHPEKWVKCAKCHKWHPVDDTTDGVCWNCESRNICGYCTSVFDSEYLHSDDEEIDENTMFFVIDVDDEDEKICNSSVKDILRLEYVNNGLNTLISHPMTWQYLVATKDKLAVAFDELRNAGNLDGNGSEPFKLRVHVLYNSFADMKPVERVAAIVNRFSDNIAKFTGKRASSYRNIPEICTSNDLAFLHNPGLDNAVKLNDMHTPNDSVKHTVIFRIFRGTLNIDAFFAFVELVKNIVTLANSDSTSITFDDLIYGEYVPTQVEYREKQGFVFDRNIAVSFFLNEISSYLKDL